MKKKEIDDLAMADYIKDELNKGNIDVDKELILKILNYQLNYLKSQGLVK